MPTLSDLQPLYVRHDDSLERMARTADVWNYLHEFVFKNYPSYGSLFS